MSIELFTYEDQPVRTITLDGEPWFVLADLCRVLDIKNVKQLRDRLDDGVCQTYPISDSLGRTQQATVVSEPGMYEVVIRSDKPEAAAFRRWITHEVIPSIRKTGGYGQVALSGPELMAKALIEASRTLEALEANLAVAQPKADTWDAICSGKGDLTITDAAKVLGRAGVETGPRKLHQQMLALGWIYKNQRGKWIAKQDQINAGTLAERVRHYIDDDGVSALATPQVRITAKGLDRLRVVLADQPALEVA